MLRRSYAGQRISARRPTEPAGDRTLPDASPRDLAAPGSLASVEPLDHRGDPLAYADAHRGQAVATASPPELVDKHRHEARAAGTERVAQRDRAAVHVDLRRIELQLIDAHDEIGRAS